MLTVTWARGAGYRASYAHRQAQACRHQLQDHGGGPQEEGLLHAARCTLRRQAYWQARGNYLPISPFNSKTPRHT